MLKLCVVCGAPFLARKTVNACSEQHRLIRKAETREKWKAANGERMRATIRDWRRKNRDKMREYERRYKLGTGGTPESKKRRADIKRRSRRKARSMIEAFKILSRSLNLEEPTS